MAVETNMFSISRQKTAKTRCCQHLQYMVCCV